MSNIITYSGKFFDPCDADETQIAIEDIAHALSLVCRSGGQFPQFYSVGQHCIACAAEAKARGYSRKQQLFCLLHDASEAFIADITRPVKQELSQYLVFEKALQDKIYKKFVGAVPDSLEQEKISLVDDCMLYHEFKAIMDYEVIKGDYPIHISLDTAFYGFEKTEKEFLRVFRELEALS